MNRRDVLHLGFGTAVGSLSWNLWAVPQAGVGSKFLLIFLRGGYDSLSALVPYTSAFYFESRPNIAIPAPKAGNHATALELDADWAMHPSMRDSLLPFWEARQLAFVPFFGTDFGSRSHFQAQDQIELGADFKNQARINSGFLNRLSIELGSKNQRSKSISFTQTLPIIMRGDSGAANSSIKHSLNQEFEADIERGLLMMYDNHKLGPMVREGVHILREFNESSLEQMEAASRGAAPSRGFPSQADRIGRLMRMNPEYAIGFVEIGGWDTHVRQGALAGRLADSLSSLALGLQSLEAALGPEWARTTVVVISEFGRTFRENGSQGTDHGHGTTLLVMGGGVSGGRVLGNQIVLSPKTIQENRETPVLNEYRAVLAGIFQKQYGLGAGNLNRIFPGVVAADFGII